MAVIWLCVYEHLGSCAHAQRLKEIQEIIREERQRLEVRLHFDSKSCLSAEVFKMGLTRFYFLLRKANWNEKRTKIQLHGVSLFRDSVFAVHPLAEVGCLSTSRLRGCADSLRSGEHVHVHICLRDMCKTVDRDVCLRGTSSQHSVQVDCVVTA